MGRTQLIFFENDGKGNFTCLGDTGLGEAWPTVIAGHFSSHPGYDLLCYNPENGVAALYAVDSHGQLSLINGDVFPNRADRPDEWKHLMIGTGHFFRDSKYDDLYAYGPQRHLGVATGEGGLYQFDDAGRVSRLGSFPRAMGLYWDIIVAGYFAPEGPKAVRGASGLLCYDRDHGTGHFYTVGDGGKSFDLRLYGQGGWRRTWSLIVPIRYGLDKQSTDALLFYDRAEGTGHFFVTDGKGGLQHPKDEHGNPSGVYDKGWSKDWQQIIAGSFFTPCDLLFHQGAYGVGSPGRVPAAKGMYKIYPVDKYAKISPPKVLPEQKARIAVVSQFFPQRDKQFPHDILFYSSLE
jgi:hypothetical protein